MLSLSDVRKDLVKEYCDLIIETNQDGKWVLPMYSHLVDKYREIAASFTESEKYYASLELQHRNCGKLHPDMAFKINNKIK